MATVECVIPGRHLKAFSKIISTLSKVGEEMWIEATSQRMVLRALNPSRSAFFAFFLEFKYFERYFLLDGVDRKFQVKIKPCLAVFKQYNNAESCLIQLDEKEQRLVFELICKHGIKKTYKLTFEECDPVQAVYSREDALNRILIAPKKLSDCIANFANSLEEVTLVVTKDNLKIKSHVDDSKTNLKALQTELMLSTLEMEEYEIMNDTEATFCLKELRALLSFCDAFGQHISLLFERGGRPLVITTKLYGLLECDFVLATLADQRSTSQQSNSSTATASNKQSTPQQTNDQNQRIPQSPSSQSNIQHRPVSQPTTPTSNRFSVVVSSPSPQPSPRGAGGQIMQQNGAAVDNTNANNNNGGNGVPSSPLFVPNGPAGNYFNSTPVSSGQSNQSFQQNQQQQQQNGQNQMTHRSNIQSNQNSHNSHFAQNQQQFYQQQNGHNQQQQQTSHTTTTSVASPLPADTTSSHNSSMNRAEDDYEVPSSPQPATKKRKTFSTPFPSLPPPQQLQPMQHNNNQQQQMQYNNQNNIQQQRRQNNNQQQQLYQNNNQQRQNQQQLQQQQYQQDYSLQQDDHMNVDGQNEEVPASYV